MKYEAKVTFAGQVTMRKGEVKELERSIASPLLKCGYIEVVKKESKRDNSTSDIQSNKGSGRKSGNRRQNTSGSDKSGSD